MYILVHMFSLRGLPLYIFLFSVAPQWRIQDFPKCASTYHFAKLLPKTTHYTLWHSISFCRSAIGLPPAGQKLNNRVFSKLFGALFYEAFLQASRVVVVFI